MQTHNSNVGKVIKDIAMVTLQTLENFNINYDELLFGKPIADIYIDDKSLNPYMNNISSFGFFYINEEQMLNKIKNNKYNKIEKKNNIIIKTGPLKYLKGEAYFYKNIPNDLKYIFPKYFNDKLIDDNIELEISYINGIPLYFLYKNNTLTTSIIDKLFLILQKLHNYDYPINIDHNLIKKNYLDKLKDRFNKIDYNFDDADYIYDEIINNLSSNYNAKIVPIIHGDFWFSNIISTYNDDIILLDMRGQVYDYLTLNGDMYYDYGKLYQSILGYDLILNGDEFNIEYMKIIQDYFLKKCHENNLDLNYLRWVTKSLVFGTLYFLNDLDKSNIIWDFVKSI